MKLISLNIELNRHHELVLPFLKSENADVICLQELLEEDFDMYKKELGMDGVHRILNYITDNVHIESYGKREGIAIFAKNIIDSGFVFHVGEKEDIDVSFDKYSSRENIIKNRALIWADVKNNDEVFRIVTTHLTITHHGEVTSIQIEDNQRFISNIKKLGEFVLCGDTNAPRGMGAYKKIAEEFKDNIPEKYITSLDKDLHRAKGLEYMVDCLFTTPKYKASEVKLHGGVSDHMAVVAEINKI